MCTSSNSRKDYLWGVMQAFNYKKAVQALNYFAIQEGGIINKLKVLKLVFLADRLHLRRYGRPILGDTYFALEHGPVASGVKDLAENTSFQSTEESAYRNQFLNTLDNHTFASIGSVENNVFSQTDIDALALIYQKFGHVTKYDLRDITHEFPEWRKWEESLKAGNSRFEMSYLDFFLKENKYAAMLGENDELVALSKEIFLEDSNLNGL